MHAFYKGLEFGVLPAFGRLPLSVLLQQNRKTIIGSLVDPPRYAIGVT
jgi:hypothetical protein